MNIDETAVCGQTANSLLLIMHHMCAIVGYLLIYSMLVCLVGTVATWISWTGIWGYILRINYYIFFVVCHWSSQNRKMLHLKAYHILKWWYYCSCGRERESNEISRIYNCNNITLSMAVRIYTNERFFVNFSLYLSWMRKLLWCSCSKVYCVVSCWFLIIYRIPVIRVLISFEPCALMSSNTYVIYLYTYLILIYVYLHIFIGNYRTNFGPSHKCIVIDCGVMKQR